MFGGQRAAVWSLSVLPPSMGLGAAFPPFTWVQELTQVNRLLSRAPLLPASFGKQKSGLALTNYKIWKYFLGHGFIQATLTLIIYSLLLFLT